MQVALEDWWIDFKLRLLWVVLVGVGEAFALAKASQNENRIAVP